MRREVRLAAHAKINLRLVVLAKQLDGYHAIETLFHKIALADDVTVRAGGASRGAEVGPPRENLAFRAAEAYAAATGWPDGFQIEIEKRIPAGGGLGGGSADAGAVLRALDALAPAPLGDGLLELALPLGADVPVMTLRDPFVLAWGRGERMLPLAPPPTRSVAVAFPPFPVVTRDAYRWLSESRTDHRPVSAVIRPAQIATWDGIATIARNDFEPVVSGRYPAIADLLSTFRTRGASVALLAGSGSSVFGVFEDESAATAALAATGAFGVVSRTTRVVVQDETNG